jgi:XRE family transcriptional regulator, fatty acid utilization regulator
MTKRRIFAGGRLRALRGFSGLNQAEMAARLAISVSYLSQIEHDDRPLTAPILAALAQHFPLDWNAFEEDDATRRFAALREAAADPLFLAPLSPEQLTRIAEQQPALADQFIALHAAYRHAGERLQIVDEALTTDTSGGSRLPWEDVRDWFHNAGNYVDVLDRAAEMLASQLGGPTIEGMEGYIRNRLGISLIYQAAPGMRDYDATMAHRSEPACRKQAVPAGAPIDSNCAATGDFRRCRRRKAAHCRRPAIAVRGTRKLRSWRAVDALCPVPR